MKKALPILFVILITTIGYSQTQFSLPVLKDNTIFSEDVNLSLGAGTSIFMGRTNLGDNRRALIKFDFSSIPAGSIVTDASISMTATNGKGGSRSIDIHALTKDWGEGSSNNSSNPGQGGTATSADCTWGYAFWSQTMWTNPGGDFGSSLASASVDGAGTYTWSSNNLNTLIQDIIDGNFANNGFIFIGDESTNQTAKKFNSREAGSGNPDLSVTISSPTSLSGSIRKNGFLISPNPVTDNFKLLGNSKVASLEIFDLKGSRVKVLNPTFQNHNIKDINRGIYLLKIHGDGFTITKKLIKK